MTGKQTSQTIKMRNANSNTTYGEKCKIVYHEYENKPIGFKSHKAINDFVFNLGDKLMFTAHELTACRNLGSCVVVDTPEVADTPEMNSICEFDIIGGLRCPNMPTITDVDGNTYNTVQIGNQCWMKENLKTTTYSNGTSISNVTDPTPWLNLTTGAYVWYDNDITWKDSYGTLYSWYTAIYPNILCPEGWHVPTDEEWTALSNYIRGTSSPHGNELKHCRQVNSTLGGGCNSSKHPR